MKNKRLVKTGIFTETEEQFLKRKQEKNIKFGILIVGIISSSLFLLKKIERI